MRVSNLLTGFLLLFSVGVLACRAPAVTSPSPRDEAPPDAPTVATLKAEGPSPLGPRRDPASMKPGIVGVAPHGVAAAWDSIELSFTHAMQPATEGPAAPTFTLDPPAPGVFTWVDPYRVVFSADDHLALATSYTVHVSGDLVTATGEPLAVDERWSFETQRPSISVARSSNWYGADNRFHWKSKFLVDSSEIELSPATLSKHVRAIARPLNGEGEEVDVPVRVRRPTTREREEEYLEERTLVVVPRTHWPLDTEVELVVDADLPTGGPLPLGRAVSDTMDIQAGNTAELECYLEYDDGCDPGPLSLTLSNPISAKQLGAIEVVPRPPRLKIEFTYESRFSGDTVEIHGRFEAGKRYRIRTKKGLTDLYGQPLTEPLDQAIDFVQPPPQVVLRGSHGTLPAVDQRTIGLETRWVERVRVRAAVLTDSQLVERWLHEPSRLRLPSDPKDVYEEVIDLDIDGDLGWASTAIDLEAITKGERRPVLVEAEALEIMKEARDRPAPSRARAIYQQTDIGAVSVVSPARSVAHVVDLDQTRPRAGITGDLYDAAGTKPKHVAKLDVSGADGILELPPSPEVPELGLLLLRKGEEDRYLARVGHKHQNRRSHVGAYSDEESLRSAIATERPIYRPGDEVHVVGWSALVTNHVAAGLRPPKAGTPVDLVLTDHDDEEVARRRVHTKASGKYWGVLKIPERAGLGYYRVRATVDGKDFDRHVRVKDFRVPTFEVDLRAAKTDVLHGDTVDLSLLASYYFGGKVPIDELRRSERCSMSWYRPPGLETDWTVASGGPRGRVGGGVVTLVAVPEADATEGRAKLKMGTHWVPEGRPYRCTMSAGVRDISMQTVGAEATWTVHPTAYFAVHRLPSGLEPGDTVPVAVRAVDFSGARRSEVAMVEVTRNWWAKDTGGWKRKSEKVRSCKLSTTVSGDDANCDVKARKPGQYTARVVPEGDKHEISAQVSTWIGPRWRRPRDSGKVEQLTIAIEPEEPTPGENVELRIAAPEKTGQGIVVLMHGGLRRILPFSLKDGRATVEVEADQSWVPGMEVGAILPTPKNAKKQARVQYASASARAKEHRRDLEVTVEAPEEARPNDEVDIEVTVLDADGKGTASHVTVWAVDEAVLSLGEPVIPDLVDLFIADRGNRTSVENDFRDILWPYVVHGDPYAPGWMFGSLHGTGTGSGYGRGSGAGFGGRGTRVGQSPARKRFETTPIFIGDVKIGPSGKGTVRGTMPENLTTFRITAIAAAALPGTKAMGRFGNGSDRTRVTVPMALRAITPRIMRPGDRADLAGIVDNVGGPAGTVEISLALESDDAPLHAEGALKHRVRVEAGGQVRVPFPVVATKVGASKVTMRATLTPDDSSRPPLEDAMEVELEVERERTMVRRASVYGSVDEDEPVAVSVVAPEAVVPGTGKLLVRVDASLLQGLQDFARELVDYPYGCVEQTSSGLLPLVALSELARSYPLGIDDVDDYIAVGMERLRSMQTDSGGFGYWPGAEIPHPYGTAYAVFVLELAKQSGYKVPATMHRRAREYLAREVAAWARRTATQPHDDVPMVMAMHALATANQATPGLERVLDDVATMPPFVRALALMTLHTRKPDDERIDELVEDLDGLLVYKAGGATVRDEGSIFPHYFDTGPRTTAMVLMALLQVRPDHRAVEPLARGLMSLRAAGRVRNTQENAYAMLALAAYARHYEATDPRMTADVWIGNAHAVSRRIDGDRMASETATRPLVDLHAALGGSRVTMRREGEGRLYYSLGMEWSDANAGDKAFASGVSVKTQLRSEAGPVADGATVPPGSLLALDVTLTTDATIDYLAVDVPLPAGLEAVDMSIGKGRSAMVLKGQRGWWVSHSELRRDRTLLFADELRKGKWEHTVYLRATTPGSYEMPPTVAQAMYFPELQGATERRRLTVAKL